MGFQVSAREALLRQVRGLQGTDWQEDAAAFHTYGSTVLQLGRTTLDMAQKGTGHMQALASARMQLKSTLKQAAEMHSDDAVYQELQKLLAELELHEANSRQNS